MIPSHTANPPGPQAFSSSAPPLMGGHNQNTNVSDSQANSSYSQFSHQQNTGSSQVIPANQQFFNQLNHNSGLRMPSTSNYSAPNANFLSQTFAMNSNMNNNSNQDYYDYTGNANQAYYNQYSAPCPIGYSESYVNFLTEDDISDNNSNEQYPNDYDASDWRCILFPLFKIDDLIRILDKITQQPMNNFVNHFNKYIKGNNKTNHDKIFKIRNELFNSFISKCKINTKIGLPRKKSSIMLEEIYLLAGYYLEEKLITIFLRC